MSREVVEIMIRTAEEKDLQAMLDIYNYEVEHGTATFDLNKVTWKERRNWFDNHNIENHPLIVAEVEGQVAGYASLSGYREKEAYRQTVELSVYVAYEFRGRGIGRKLMEAILEDARGREDVHCVVSVITGSNERSIRLHEQFGFEFAGRIREVGMKFGKWLDIVNYQILV